MIRNVKIKHTEVIAEHFHQLKTVTYEYEKEDGTVETRDSQEVYDNGKAATILLYNKDKKTVLLTKQFRLPSYINGNKSGMLIEACAGLMEDGNPEECARREAEEELGYKLEKVEQVMEVFMSPGSVTELLYFFVAAYDESMKVAEGGGLEEEQENIDILEIPIDEAMQMINKGEIKDGKTILLLQYVKLHHIV